MRKILSCLIIVLMSFSAMAEHHGAENAELHAAIKAFDHAYANNDVEIYFRFYVDNAASAESSRSGDKLLTGCTPNGSNFS